MKEVFCFILRDRLIHIMHCDVGSCSQSPKRPQWNSSSTIGSQKSTLANELHRGFRFELPDFDAPRFVIK
jgi:hypothetical protein